jgi:hypothetical protein
VIALVLAVGLRMLAFQASSAAAPHRNLAVDEQRGGHTLARHIGRSEVELRERLRREPNISAASSYTDRATAELAVGLALDREHGRVEAWTRRHGSRPNLVLHVDAPRGPPFGVVLHRGEAFPVPARSALVVLRWDMGAGDYYVLTSYPEAW